MSPYNPPMSERLAKLNFQNVKLHEDLHAQIAKTGRRTFWLGVVIFLWACESWPLWVYFHDDQSKTAALAVMTQNDADKGAWIVTLDKALDGDTKLINAYFATVKEERKELKAMTEAFQYCLQGAK